MVSGQPFDGAPNSRLRIQEFIDALGNKNFNRAYYKYFGGTFGFHGYPGATSANELASLAIRSRTENGEMSVLRALYLQMTGPESAKRVPVYPLPWWDLQKGLRSTVYADGSKEVNSSHIMQFASMSRLSTTEIREFKSAFDDALACVQDTPIPISKAYFNAATQKGRAIYLGQAFAKNQDCACVRCHGSSDPRYNWSYPEHRVPLSSVKTDETYFNQKTSQYEDKLHRFAELLGDRPHKLRTNKRYYVAPPLVALWAKPALLHNRSVPTLYDLLCTRESDRPKRWRLNQPAPDVMSYNSVDRDPSEDSFNQPIYYTNKRGFSNIGHNYCTEELGNNPDLCQSLISYLEQL
ncbi:MAG: hypothetical protein AB7K41_13280 [Bdellovibrionales bacterium]